MARSRSCHALTSENDIVAVTMRSGCSIKSSSSVFAYLRTASLTFAEVNSRKNHPVPLTYGYEESHRSESWAEHAARLGWDAMALFGCAPRRPLDYSGSAGLLWAMNGGRLVELHRDWAGCCASHRSLRRRRGGLTIGPGRSCPRWTTGFRSTRRARDTKPRPSCAAAP